METVPVDRNGMVVLSKAECMNHLGRNGLGRVAITVGALPAVFPINYAVDGEYVYFRTAAGTKLAAAARNAVVAFEVDHVDRMAHTGWSVLVIGPAEEVVDHDTRATADELPLARWLPGGVETLVRIRAELVSGRAITLERTAVFPSPPADWSLAACPACGSDALRAVHDGQLTNVLCTTCLACWHTELGVVYRIASATCLGCEFLDLCMAAHAR